MKHPIIYTVLALPASLCGGNDSVDAIVAFVLPPHYPFKPPRAFMLTPGVFMPSASECRGRGKPVRISKVPALQEEWSPALFLDEVCGLILSELGDMSKWKRFLTRREGKLLPLLHASCTPCTLPQTLATQEWLPTDLSRLGSQCRDMRVGSSGSRLPETVLALLQTFIGKLSFMLSMSLTSPMTCCGMCLRAPSCSKELVRASAYKTLRRPYSQGEQQAGKLYF